ncbi:MAG: hypothetical protein NTY38_04405 [Acidobacteria bacterium]|nr:hypothetical protein [Acidobacteriota bacterium]
MKRAALLILILAVGLVLFIPFSGPDRDTSTPAIAPPWSLEPWMWEDDSNTAAAVQNLIDGCRQHDIPLGAVLLDSPWSTAYNNFVFDEKRYPNARGMIEVAS